MFTTRFFTVISTITLSILAFNCKSQYADLEDGIYAEIDTNKGKMVAQLFYKRAPITSANFIALAEGTNPLVDSIYSNKPFYNGLIFHRVIDNFMIQGGDPLGTGAGNPGYRFINESHPELKHDKPGMLAMANSGPNTNGSQFYITEIAKPQLDGGYTVFGTLVEGLNIQDSISNVETDARDKPLDSVYIKQLNIIRKGRDANSFNAPEVFKNHFAIEEERIAKEKARKAQFKTDSKTKHTAQKLKAVALNSGLKYFISKAGNGPELKETSKVMTHYALFLEDGTLLETSDLKIAEALEMVNKRKKRAGAYRPILADLSPNAAMIPGFKEGLQHLRVGDKATLFIPYHLGYGEAGNRAIPPKTNLIFEVEVLQLN